MSPKALYLFVKRYIKEICTNNDFEEFQLEIPSNNKDISNDATRGMKIVS